MRSEIRVFKDKGYVAKGSVLPLSEFRLCRDVENPRISDDMGAYYVSEAEKMLGETIPILPLSLYRDFKLTGVRSRFERIHHARRRFLFYMTLAEAYERQGRFVEKIADILWAILEETSWIIPAHYSLSVLDPETQIPEVYREDQMYGLDLYGATTSGLVAFVGYILKDELDGISPVIRKRISHLVYLRGIRPFVSVDFWWSGMFGEGNCSNWLTNIVSLILLATAVTAEDTALRERVVDKSMKYLDNFTAYYPADGYCDEGPGYWGGAGGNYFDCLEIIEDMTDGKFTVYDADIVKKIGEYVASVNVAGKYYLNFADAHPVLEQPGKMIMRYGEKCKSAELYSFGKMTAANNSISRYYAFDMVYRVYKDALFPEVSLADKVVAKKSVWFDGGKVAILRESENPDKGLFLAMKGGNNGESHNHKDVGCIVVYSDGKPVIVDPSHGSYDNGFFGPTRYGRWYMKSSYHSIPTVDGTEQSVGKDRCSKDEIFSADEKTVSMELAGAFPDDSGILSMRRTCSLKNSMITVKDEVKLGREGDIQFNYLTLDEPKVIKDGTLEISEGRIFEYDPAGLEYIAEKVENTWLPYEDLNFQRLWQRDCLWRICLKARAKEKCLEVIIK